MRDFVLFGIFAGSSVGFPFGMIPMILGGVLGGVFFFILSRRALKRDEVP